MPIRRDLRKLYPSNWAEISQRIRFDRAGGRCERCSRPHGWTVLCLPDGRWFDAASMTWRSELGAAIDEPDAQARQRAGIMFVVLTCAHVDHDPSHSEDDNLAAWCARCHLLHDAEHHKAQRWLTYRRRWAVADLFLGVYSRIAYPGRR